MKKVLIPKWWAESDKDIIGYTDCEDTYCCCTTPSWFVEVPEYEYAGYFNVRDLQVVN